jgi:hypothetical protein
MRYFKIFFYSNLVKFTQIQQFCLEGHVLGIVFRRDMIVWG